MNTRPTFTVLISLMMSSSSLTITHALSPSSTQQTADDYSREPSIQTYILNPFTIDDDEKEEKKYSDQDDFKEPSTKVDQQLYLYKDIGPYLLVHDIKKEEVHKFEKWLRKNDYDTDAVLEDLEKETESNIKDQFKDIHSKLQIFFQRKGVPKTLSNMPCYPSPYEYALLSKHVYRDCKKGEGVKLEIDETIHNLPTWKVYKSYKSKHKSFLATTAKNLNLDYGYRGILYHNPVKHQMVLAHRGTDPKNFDALLIDVQAISDNREVYQEKIIYDIIQECLAIADWENCTLSFTGHSIGGWFAEMSVYYFHDSFQKDYPHLCVKAVTFDTLGARPMMEKIKEDKQINIDTALDITNYLSSPNYINSWNKRVGDSYRVIFSVFAEEKEEKSSDKTLTKAFSSLLKFPIDKEKIEYTIKSHSLSNFVQAFDKTKGHAKQCCLIHTWPSSIPEFSAFYEKAKFEKNYHPKSGAAIYYQYKNIKPHEQRERLSHFYRLRLNSDNVNPSNLVNPKNDYGLPSFHTKHILDREELIEKIEEHFKRQKKYPTQRLALKGIGGSGKSTLAYQYCKTEKSKTIIWLNAENETSLTNSLREIIPDIDPNSQNKVQDKDLQQLKHQLRKKLIERSHAIHWFLIFDNVDKPEQLQGIIPHQNASVLVTTRNERWPGSTLKVDEFNKKTAIQFLNRFHSPEEEKEKKAQKDIIDMLGGLPLFLELTGFYLARQVLEKKNIKQPLTLYQDYLKNLKYGHTRRLLYKKLEGLKATNYEQGHSGESLTLSPVINIDALNKENAYASQVLHILAYLNPDEIPIKLLEYIPNKVATSNKISRRWDYKIPIKTNEVYEIIDKISQFGFINIDHTNTQISIHRLVQLCLRDHITNEKESLTARFSKIKRPTKDQEKENKIHKQKKRHIEEASQMILNFWKAYNKNEEEDEKYDLEESYHPKRVDSLHSQYKEVKPNKQKDETGLSHALLSLHIQTLLSHIEEDSSNIIQLLHLHYRFTQSYHEEDFYLPPLAKETNGFIEFDLHSKVLKRFLKEKKSKLLVLTGEAGTGKSTYGKYLTHVLWERYQKGEKKHIPLFISLPEFAIHGFPKDLIYQVFSKKGLNEKAINVIQRSDKISFVFIFDGYDETNEVANLFRSFDLTQWGTKQTKYILSVRSNYKEKINNFLDSFPSPPWEYTIQKFPKKDIETYIKKFAKSKYNESNWKADEYISALDALNKNNIPDILSLMTTPFLLVISLQTLPKLTKEKGGLSNVSSLDIYEVFINEWLERECNKPKSMTTKQEIQSFCENLAYQLFITTHNTSNNNQEEEQKYNEDEDDTKENKSPQKGKIIKRDDKKMQHFFKDQTFRNAPLKQVSPGNYQFILPSFQYFFCTKKILIDPIKQLPEEMALSKLSKQCQQTNVFDLLNKKRLSSDLYMLQWIKISMKKSDIEEKLSFACMYAALQGCSIAVKSLHDLDVSFDKPNQFNETVLQAVVLTKDNEARKMMIGFCISNGYGQQMLYCAVRKGNIEVLIYLVENLGIDSDVQDKDGRTVLHYAAQGGSIEMIKYLVEDLGIDSDVQDKDGRTVLHYAAQGGSIEMIKYLVEDAGVDSDVQDKDDRTALHYAAMGGNLKGVKYLVEKDKDGKTVLHYAAQGGSIEVIKFLVEEKKANPLAKDKDKRTVLHYAAMGGNLKMVKFLLKELKTLQYIYYSLAHDIEIEKEKVDRFENWLHENNYDSDAVLEDLKEEKESNIRHEFKEDIYSTIKKLFKEADPRAKDKDDKTVLHYAAMGGNIKVVKFLVEDVGIDSDVQDKGGKTVLHYAVEKGNIKMVKFLVKELKTLEHIYSFLAHDIEKEKVDKFENWLRENDHDTDAVLQDLEKETESNIKDQFKDIHSKLQLLFQRKGVPKTSSNMPSYPSPYEYALLSKHVYKDYKKGEGVELKIDETIYNLPTWEVYKFYKSKQKSFLATTAKNLNLDYGYRGILYHNPVKHQMVLAHRGTDPKNFDALLTDVQAITNSKEGYQEKIIYDIIQECLAIADWENCTLSFTGHSLGGWLAQMSVHYFHNSFQEDYPRLCVKAVTFDTPGARTMIEKIKEDKQINIDTARNITNYLSSPNYINSCNKRVGDSYRVIFSVFTEEEEEEEEKSSDKTFIKALSSSFRDATKALASSLGVPIKEVIKIIKYTIKSHSSGNFIQAFDKAEGLAKQCYLIQKWPSLRSEFHSFYSKAKKTQKYDPQGAADIYYQYKNIKPHEQRKLQSRFYDPRLNSDNVNPSNLVNPKNEYGLPSFHTKHILYRKKLIKKIKKNFKRQKKYPTQRLALEGIGGSGKSTLAYQYCKTEKSKTIIWLNAENETSLTNSLMKIIPDIDPNSQNKVQDKKLKELKHQLRKKLIERSHAIHWFLIFDNVDKPEQLQGIIPHKNASVLVTTRNEKWPGSTLKVDEFDKETAKEFLTKFDGKRKKLNDKENESLEKIIEILGRLPLVLELTYHYLKSQEKENPLTLYEDYLKKLKNRQSRKILYKKIQILNKNTATNHGQGRNTESLTLSAVINMDKLNPDASQVLHILAYLNPDEIPIKLLKYISKRGAISNKLSRSSDCKISIKNEVYDIIDKISKLGFINKYDTNNKDDIKISIHRLVQLCLRDHIPNEKGSLTDRCLSKIKGPTKDQEEENKIHKQKKRHIEGAYQMILNFSKSDETNLSPALLNLHIQTLLSHIEDFTHITQLLRLHYQFTQSYHQEDFYLTPLAKKTNDFIEIADEKSDKFDLHSEVMEFINPKHSSNKSCPFPLLVLTGEAGTGKSTYGSYLTHDLWKRYKKGKKHIPLFISLPEFAIHGFPKDLIYQVFSKKGLNEKAINVIQEKSRSGEISFVFIFDGYDETNEVANLFRTSDLTQWGWGTGQTKYILNVRSNYKEKINKFLHCPYTNNLKSMYKYLADHDIEKKKVEKFEKCFPKNDYKFGSLSSAFSKETESYIRIKSDIENQFQDIHSKLEIFFQLDFYKEKLFHPFHLYAVWTPILYQDNYLENKGADPTKKDEDDRTVLHYAARGGSRNRFQFESKYDDDSDAKEDEDEANIKKLLKKADPLAKDKDGKTVLHYYAEKGNIKMVEFLVQKKADPRAKDGNGATVLHYAAQGGNIKVVKFLVQNGADPRAKDEDDRTVLHYAAQGGNIKVIKFLVEEKKADPRAKDEDDRTVLHYAAQGGNIKVVKFLVDKGADPNKKDKDDQTVLHYYAEKGNIKMVEFLVQKKADPRAKDGNGATVLHYAARGGSIQVVKFLVEELKYIEVFEAKEEEEKSRNLFKKTDPLARDKNGKTVLHYAAQGGNIKVVKFLVQNGVDPRAKDEDGKTVLHYAARGGNIKMVEFLVQKDADPRAKDKDDKTVLHYAAAGDNIEVVKFLVQKKANLRAKDNDGKTVLHYAAAGDNIEVVKFLVEEKKANLHAKDNDDRTVLHYAAQLGHIGVVKFLVDKGADPNKKDQYGQTLLHYYAEGGNIKMVEFLVDKGADPNKKDQYDQTLLHYYAKRGNIKMVEFLVQKKANPRAKDKDKRTVLHYAAFAGSIEMVKFLVQKKANPRAKDKDDRTVLHYAAQGGNIKVVKFLVEEKKADPCAKDKDDQRVLHYAATGGNIEMVKYLVEVKDVNVNAKNKYGYTSLYWAYWKGHLHIVRYLVEEKKADLVHCDSLAWRPREYTIQKLIEENINTYIKKFAKSNYNQSKWEANTYISIVNKLEGSNIKSIRSLMTIPFLLVISLQALPKLTKEKRDVSNVSLFDIYEAFIDKWLERECNKPKSMATKQEIQHFCENLAYQLFVATQKASSNNQEEQKYNEDEDNTKENKSPQEGKIIRRDDKNMQDFFEKQTFRNAPLKQVSPGRYQFIQPYFEWFFCTKKILIDPIKQLPEEMALSKLSKQCQQTNIFDLLNKKRLNSAPKMLKWIKESIKKSDIEEKLLFACMYAALQGYDIAVRSFVEDLGVPHSAESETLLHYAAWGGNLEVVKFLVDKGADPRAKDKDKRTVLHYAAQGGSIEVIKFLVEEKKANPLAKDKDGKTVLHYAAQGGSIEVIKYLVEEKKANPLAKDKDGKTVLHYAAQGGSIEVIKYLVEEKKANPLAKDKDKRTVLHYAAMGGNIKVVEFLEDKGADPTKKDKDDKTVLHYAAMGGNIKMVKFLVKELKTLQYIYYSLAHDIEKEKVDKFKNWLRENNYDSDAVLQDLKEEKESNIRHEFKEDIYSTIKKLFKEEALNKKDRYNATVLHYAAEGGNIEVVKFLVDKGADPRAKDEDDRTVLHYAAQGGNIKVVKFLVEEKKADPRAKDEDDRTVLHYAAQGGNIEVVKFLVNQDIDLDRKDQYGQTVLHYYAGKGSLKMVKFLVDKGADPNKKDQYGQTLLHYYAEGGNIKMVVFLVDKGADPNKKDKDGKTVLHYAAFAGSIEMVKFLVQKKADPRAKDQYGQTVLHYYAGKGSIKMVKFLVDTGVDPNKKDQYGQTLLHYYAEGGNIKMVVFLVDKGADPNKKDKDGKTVLHYAAFAGSIEMVKFLVQKKADPRAKDKDDRTVLHYAAELGHIGVAEFLVEEKKADPRAKDKDGRTVLHYATAGDNIEVVKFLVQKKANPRAKDKDDRTVLHYAAEGGNIDVVKFLVEEKKADPRAKDKDDRTVLHYAAQGGSIEMIKYLVEDAGVDSDVQDKDDRTALHYAAMGGNIKVVVFLEDKGADPTKKDKDDKTVLHYAAMGGNLKMVKFLVKELKTLQYIYYSLAHDIEIEKEKVDRFENWLHENNYDSDAVLEDLKEEKESNIRHGFKEDIYSTIKKLFKVAPNKKDKDGKTALHYAAEKGNIKMVEFLVQKDKDGKTVLHYAAELGHIWVVKFLVEELKYIEVFETNEEVKEEEEANIKKLFKKADPRAKDKDGRTVLHYAAQGGNIEVAEFLVEEKKADPRAKDKDGKTVLHYAAEKGNLEMVEFFVQKKANPRAKDKDDRTVLHYAAQGGNIDVVEFLVDKGADPRAKDKDDRTVLHYAAERGNIKMVEFLVDRGADSTKKDRHGRTPLDLAKKYG